MAKGTTYRTVGVDGYRSLCIPLSLWPALTGIISDNEFQFHPDCWQGMVERVINMPECGSYGWDGSDWHKLPLMWGYTDRLFESLGGIKSGDGVYDVQSSAVPAGEIHVIQRVSLRNVSGSRGTMLFSTGTGGVWITLAWAATQPQFTPLMVAGPIVIKAGDTIRVLQNNCLNGDVLEGGIWGYKMKVAE